MFFDLIHRLYPVDRPVTLRFVPVFPVKIDRAAAYTLRVIPFSGLKKYAMSKAGRALDEKTLRFFTQPQALCRQADALTLSALFPQEDRYILELSLDGALVERIELYALNEDLFHTLPYRGDCHLHSCLSDGSESPEYMAAASRRRGCDFVAITDHYAYAPSLRAKSVIDPLGLDFALLPGEEIHAPGNNLHVINLGGRQSVTEWFTRDPEDYERAVAQKLPLVPEAMLPDNRYAAASTLALFDKIRAFGGAAVLCHPHWIHPFNLQEAEDITDFLFENPAFDALELVAGGAFEVGTQLQLSYYQDQRALPVLGNSDAHCANGGRMPICNFTIAFADELSPSGILRAVLKGFTVAGYENRLFGPYRLVKFAYFCLDNLFPRHDELCQKEGKQLIRYVENPTAGDGQLAQTRGAVSDLYASCRYPD